MMELLLNLSSLWDLQIQDTLSSVIDNAADVKGEFNPLGGVKIINWEELNLIPGESRVFFDGSYLGRSFIDPNITSDTLLFSLGKDKSIVMTRKKLKDKTKEKSRRS